MTIKLIVIDDDDVDAILKNLMPAEYTYTAILPKSFAEDISKIIEGYDLILMDQNLSGSIEKIPYMGTTLVQELRTRMAENVMVGRPIILWSIAGNITSYAKENSSHNLVDAVWKKEWLDPTNLCKIAKCKLQMKVLIDGYKQLNDFLRETGVKNIDRPKLISSIFGLNLEQYSVLVPENVKGYFENDNHHVAHTMSQFLINSVLRFNGFLIDEETLAARLGVAIKSKGWKVLTSDVLNEFKYKGIYSEYYERWWAVEIDNWWLQEVNNDHLAGLTAQQRILILNKHYNMKLDKAGASEGHSEEMFWHTCIISKVPIDPTDSFKLTSSERREWQEHFYASYDTIINKNHKDFGFELFPRDKVRFLKLKDKLKNASK